MQAAWQAPLVRCQSDGRRRATPALSTTCPDHAERISDRAVFDRSSGLGPRLLRTKWVAAHGCSSPRHDSQTDTERPLHGKFAQPLALATTVPLMCPVASVKTAPGRKVFIHL